MNGGVSYDLKCDTYKEPSPTVLISTQSAELLARQCYVRDAIGYSRVWPIVDVLTTWPPVRPPVLLLMLTELLPGGSACHSRQYRSA